MNEVTKIHLGRQSFVIAADAYKALQDYLHEIKRQAGKTGQEVTKEVELRMAELLTERGISGDKVVLIEDIDYLKKQLGEPRDFKDDDDEDASEKEKDESDTKEPKRLFRDTENGMLAGVAAGLAAYTGIPALIFRLLFIALTLSGALGILIYILLWLLMPEAKSPSDRLQMNGIAVTVETLKKSVEEADIEGAATRAGRVAGRSGLFIAKVFALLLGICFIIAGFAMLMGVAVAASYLLTHGLDLGNAIIFPVGASEILIVICGVAVATTVAAMFALVGKALASRKWKFSGWLVAVIASIFVTSAVVGTAMSISQAPTLQARYNAQIHTDVRDLPAFSKVSVKQGNATVVSLVSDERYYVEVKYVGAIDPATIVTTVKDGTLHIDTSATLHGITCHLLCPYGSNNVMLYVHAPSGFSGSTYDGGDGYTFDVPPYSPEPSAPADLPVTEVN